MEDETVEKRDEKDDEKEEGKVVWEEDEFDEKEDEKDIHSKSRKVCGVCFSVTNKSAEKVRKSRHKNFPLIDKKSKNAPFESNMYKDLSPRTC